MEEGEVAKKYYPAHPWEARLIVGVLMLILSFIGLVITDMHQDMAWDYWRIIVIVNALLSISLNLYLRRDKKIFSPSALGKELLHWGGLVLAMYLVSIFVSMGLQSRFLGSLQLMTLLAFAIFMAGVYVESTFMVVGLLLGFFCLTVAYAAEYLYYIVLPLCILGGVALYFIVKRKARRSNL